MRVSSSPCFQIADCHLFWQEHAAKCMATQGDHLLKKPERAPFLPLQLDPLPSPLTTSQNLDEQGSQKASRHHHISDMIEPVMRSPTVQNITPQPSRLLPGPTSQPEARAGERGLACLATGPWPTSDSDTLTTYNYSPASDTICPTLSNKMIESHKPSPSTDTTDVGDTRPDGLASAFQKGSPAKATMKPSSGLGLARLPASGPAGTALTEIFQPSSAIFPNHLAFMILRNPGILTRNHSMAQLLASTNRYSVTSAPGHHVLHIAHPWNQ